MAKNSFKTRPIGTVWKLSGFLIRQLTLVTMVALESTYCCDTKSVEFRKFLKKFQKSSDQL